MSTLLIDTSVIVKWFHEPGEPEVRPARALLDSHVAGELDLVVLDLGYYELGNVLSTALRWPAMQVADQLDDLRTICGDPVVPEPSWLREAAAIAHTHRLTFYDAAWSAAADAMGIALVSADRKLRRSGLAESPAEAAARLRI